MNIPPARLSWTIWGLAAAFYLYAFFQRVAPGVMTAELSAEFGLSASALGYLSAFYFYSYVAMQIPTGILADLWGPRRLLTAGAMVATVGALFFAFSNSLVLVAIGRLLIGGAVAVAFVCMLKLASHWLDPRQFALATGLALMVGIVGAVFAGAPLRLAVETYGWRPAMAISALFPFLVGIAIWLKVRDDPSEKGYRGYINHPAEGDENPLANALSGLAEVIRYRNAWLLAIVPGGVVGSILSFAGLWGVPFLTTHYGLADSQAAFICSAMLIVWAFSGPLFGGLSDRSGQRKPLYMVGCALVFLCWGAIVLVPGMPLFTLIAILMIASFFSGCMVLGFAFAKESVPANLAGTVSGMVNMGVISGPMLLQPALGWMLDNRWGGQSSNGMKVFDLAAYQAGFALLMLWTLVSFVLILFTRESRRA